MSVPAPRGRPVRVAASYSADELRDQWAFLDKLVDRQAASLRAGFQDPEEEDIPLAVTQPTAAAPAPDEATVRELESLRRNVLELEILRQRVRELEQLRDQVSELDELRVRVRQLEDERNLLLERLRQVNATPLLEPPPADVHRRLPSWLRRGRRGR